MVRAAVGAARATATASGRARGRRAAAELFGMYTDSRCIQRGPDKYLRRREGREGREGRQAENRAEQERPREQVFAPTYYECTTLGTSHTTTTPTTTTYYCRCCDDHYYYLTLITVHRHGKAAVWLLVGQASWNSRADLQSSTTVGKKRHSPPKLWLRFRERRAPRIAPFGESFLHKQPTSDNIMIDLRSRVSHLTTLPPSLSCCCCCAYATHRPLQLRCSSRPRPRRISHPQSSPTQVCDSSLMRELNLS